MLQFMGMPEEMEPVLCLKNLINFIFLKEAEVLYVPVLQAAGGEVRIDLQESEDEAIGERIMEAMNMEKDKVGYCIEEEG